MLSHGLRRFLLGYLANLLEGSLEAIRHVVTGDGLERTRTARSIDELRDELDLGLAQGFVVKQFELLQHLLGEVGIDAHAALDDVLVDVLFPEHLFDQVVGAICFEGQVGCPE